MNRTLLTQIVVGLVVFTSAVGSAEPNAKENIAGKKQESTAANKKLCALLIGTWTRHYNVIQYFRDGTYVNDDRTGESRGKWRIEGNSVIHTENGKKWTNRIIAITEDELKMTFGDGSEGLEYKRAVQL